MAGDSLRMAMVAGEASGDLLAGLLLEGSRQRWPQLQSDGIGGPRMQEQGFVAHWPSEALAVHGYSLEVLGKVYGIWKIRNQLRERLLRDRPDVFVGVDAPDFNLGLEQSLREQGIPTVHFVCPSIWACRARAPDPAQRRPCAVPVPVRAGAVAATRYPEHLCWPSAGSRAAAGAGSHGSPAGAGFARIG